MVLVDICRMDKKQQHTPYIYGFWIFLSVVVGGLFNGQTALAYQVQSDRSTILHVQEADSLYQEALRYIELENLSAAMLCMEQAVKAEPDRVEYWELILAIHQEQGQASGVAHALEQLICLLPDERKLYMDYAYILAYQEQYDEALAVYDRLSDRLGKDEGVFTGKAHVYQMMDRTQDAITELEALIEQDDAPVVAYVMLGELHAQEEAYDQALAVLDAGAARAGDQPLLNISRADVLRQTGQVDEAYVHLKRAFESHMFDQDYKAGLLYRIRGAQPSYKESQILALADQHVRQYPVSYKSHAVRAEMYAHFNKIEEAKESSLAALKLDRSVPMIWHQLIALYLFEGQAAEALPYAEEAAQLFPNEPDLLFFAGNIQQTLGHTEQARHYMEQALNATAHKASQFLSQILGSLGSIYHELDMFAASDVAHEEALTLDSLDAFTLNNYAYYLALRNDKLDRALEMSTLAVELQPDYATFEDTHAWVLFQRQEYAEALRWIERAIQHSEEPSATLLEHYGDILVKNGQVRNAVSQWRKARRYVEVDAEAVERLNQKIAARSLID